MAANVSSLDLMRLTACREAGRYRDAERFLRRMVSGTTLRGPDEADDAIRLGASLLFQGRLVEAAATFGELYAAVRERPPLQSYACRALRYQINALQRLHDGAPSEQAVANAERQALMIDAGLCWVRSIGRPAWRAGLLFHRALAHLTLGGTATGDEARPAYERALDTAEAAYRAALTDVDDSSYGLHDHAVLVARCARWAGQIDRGFEVLRGAEAHVEGTTDKVRGAVEHARLLLATAPPRWSEALETARRAARLAEGMQAPRDQLLAAEALAVSALAAASREEAREALQRVSQIAEGNATDDRRFLLRRAVRLLDGVLDSGAPSGSRPALVGLPPVVGTADSDLDPLRHQVAPYRDTLSALLAASDRSWPSEPGLRSRSTDSP